MLLFGGNLRQGDGRSPYRFRGGQRCPYPRYAMNGSLQLFECPGDIVRLSCEKCGRKGQYRKQKLIERYRAHIRLPDLREEIAQYERQGRMHDGCMVHYVDLKPK
jgi:hypothetical protein